MDRQDRAAPQQVVQLVDEFNPLWQGLLQERVEDQHLSTHGDQRRRHPATDGAVADQPHGGAEDLWPHFVVLVVVSPPLTRLQLGISL